MSIWKPTPGFESYSASDAGEVRSELTGRAIIPFRKGRAYLAVDLHYRGAFLRQYVHRLVLSTFTGPCPEGMECCHRNDIPTDNRLENLFWGTRQTNVSMRKHSSGPAQSDAVKRGWLKRRMAA